MGSIRIYKDILKYFWFIQTHGHDKQCPLGLWNEKVCIPELISNENNYLSCGFSKWNATFCYEAYNISFQKLSTIEKLLHGSEYETQERHCTLMVVLLPHVEDIMWIPIPCNEPILDNSTLYCTRKTEKYYTGFRNQSYLSSDISIKNRQTIYECQDSSTFISNTFVCDRIQDCSKEEDEQPKQCAEIVPHYGQCKSLAKINATFVSKVCPYNSSLVTSAGTPKSHGENYCIFILDGNGTLIPDKNGHHLTDCAEYTCNSSYYKCPGFYCIPWQYVCNHRIDCPGQLDEKHCSKLSCRHPMQFKCRTSTVCVTLESTCDGVIDCPFGDDEYFCNMLKTQCPSNCACHLFTVKCSSWDLQCTDCQFNYTSITVSYAILHDVSSFLQNFHQPVELILTNNHISDICIDWTKHAEVIHVLTNLALPENNLTVLASKCFNKLSSLRFVNLSLNQITDIKTLCFTIQTI